MSTAMTGFPENWLMVSSTALDVGMRLTQYVRLSLEHSAAARRLLTGAVVDVDAAAMRMRREMPPQHAPSDGLEFVSPDWVSAVDRMADVATDAMKQDQCLAEDFRVDLEDWHLSVAAEPQMREHVGKRGLPFYQAILGLTETDERFAAGRLSAVDHGRVREAWLGKALVALAAEYGVRLQQPLHIDGCGEFRLVALHPDDRSPNMGCGQFGAFVDLLNEHRPRTGIAPGRLCAENGWCSMNHFDACKLVMQAHSSAKAAAAAGPVSAEPDSPKRRLRP